MNIYRQGDVLLIQISALPEGLQTQADGEVVLALGETTGHKHRFAEGSGVCGFYKEGDDNTMSGGTLIGGATPIIAISIPEGGARLEHAGGVRADHDSISVEPGLYEVRRQREYVAEGIEKQVVD